MLFSRLYLRVYILLTSTDNTCMTASFHINTTPPLFIEVPARSQEIERSSICVLKVSTSKLIKTNGRVAGIVIVW